MKIREIFERIGFTIVFLLITLIVSIILLYPIKILETIIGEYIIVVLIALLAIISQFAYSYGRE